MSALTSPKTYAGLAAFHAVDAVACAVQVAPIKKVLDDLGVPEEVRPVLPVVKAAAAVGLLSVTWSPALARLTTAMLTLYFVLAVGAHVRARDKVLNAIPAASFLAVFALMTAKGPNRA
ncbi:MAG: DoxX family protein [Mycobacterium sp.]|uniref:DoxX family protein n=2 Tax=Mycobacterium sp. TaxID=1785 RepID=UPI00284DDF8D|nr:DoxX family protein [Mycobacterium sp.]